MNIRNLIKSIYLVSALVNLSPPGKALQSFDIETKKNSHIENNPLNKLAIPEKKKELEQNSYKKFKEDYIITSKKNDFKNVKIYSSSLLANSSDSKKELKFQFL